MNEFVDSAKTTTPVLSLLFRQFKHFVDKIRSELVKLLKLVDRGQREIVLLRHCTELIT